MCVISFTMQNKKGVWVCAAYCKNKKKHTKPITFLIIVATPINVKIRLVVCLTCDSSRMYPVLAQ